MSRQKYSDVLRKAAADAEVTAMHRRETLRALDAVEYAHAKRWDLVIACAGYMTATGDNLMVDNLRIANVAMPYLEGDTHEGR